MGLPPGWCRNPGCPAAARNLHRGEVTGAVVAVVVDQYLAFRRAEVLPDPVDAVLPKQLLFTYRALPYRGVAPAVEDIPPLP